MTSSPDTPPALPDLPGGGHRFPYGRREMLCAASLLTAGAEEAQEVATLLDEELLALDGPETGQFTALPYAELIAPDREQRRLLARTALRSLMVQGRVADEADAAQAEEREARPEAREDVTLEPSLAAVLLLRRLAADIVWFEREQPQDVQRRYYYLLGPLGTEEEAGEEQAPADAPVPQAALEEEVTAQGIHVFRIMPRAQVAERVLEFVDPEEVPGADGPARTVATADLLADPVLGEEVGRARSLTTATRLERETETIERATFHVTDRSVLAGQPDADAEHLRIMPVSRTTLRALLTELIEPAADED